MPIPSNINQDSIGGENMNLPLTKSSAESLLDKYEQKLSNYTSGLDKAKSQLLQDLESLKKNCERICSQMYFELGYKGDLKTQEREFNLALKELQRPLSFLNGEELYDFMIRDLTAANPFSMDYQKAYEDLCLEKTSIAYSEILNETDKINWAKEILQFVGLDTKGFGFSISKDGSYVQGFNRGKGGSTPRVYLTPDFSAINGSLRKKLIDTFNDTGAKIKSINGDTVTYVYDEKYFYNLLKLSKTKDPVTNASILDFSDTTVFNDVKNTLRSKITAQASGVSDINAFNEALDEVFSKLSMTDLFTGGNAPKKMTGLLGELQAVYFIKSIIKGRDINVSWNATTLADGAQPHRDLIISTLQSQYGVQVKNSANNLKKEINFQSFKTETAKKIQDGTLFMDMPENFKNYAFSINKDVFEAATTISAMKNFNIMYRWEDKHAVAGNNDEFADVRKRIESAAALAEKALQAFSAAMMFMQTSADIKDNQDANSLYIIGGVMAISSASILSDVIEDIEKDVRRFNINTKVSQKSKDAGTIVEFLNNNKGRHLDYFSVSIQSSYNF